MDIVYLADVAGTETDTSEDTPKLKKRDTSTLSRQGTLSRLPSKQRRFYKIYRFLAYALNKARIFVVTTVELFWRFLELYLHKIVVLTLFATSISQISVVYMLLLLVVVALMVPFPYINTLTFPLVTFYLGLVTITKMVYQFPVIMDEYLDFPNANSSNCINTVVSYREVDF